MTDTFRRRQGRFLIGAGLAMITSISPIAAGRDGAWNYGALANVEAGMHACPVGTAISQIGGRPGNFNDFYCMKVTTANSNVRTVTSRGTRQISKSHACPKGYYLRGLNIAE